MKLRIQDNSVRLRLTRGEVERLDTDGEVAASAGFPGGRALRYVVRCGESDRVGARLENTEMVVSIPPSVIRGWAESEQVSIKGSEPLSGGATLAILVEKDFACLVPREGEDDSDMFPHPREGEETC